MKTYLPINVHDAAIERLNFVFDAFPRVCVSFSGGKDSTVLLHLAHQVAQTRGRTLDVLFIDWEAQYAATIAHVTEMMALPGVNPYWVALPISTSNESSFHDPMWTAWEVTPMTDIVAELLRRGWTDVEVAKELGMDADEVLRFKHHSGLPELFKNGEYSHAWE